MVLQMFIKIKKIYKIRQQSAEKEPFTVECSGKKEMKVVALRSSLIPATELEKKVSEKTEQSEQKKEKQTEQEGQRKSTCEHSKN